MTTAKESPTTEYLNECFIYDEDTGLLFWKERPSHHFKCFNDQKAWNSKYPHKKAGYNKINARGGYYYMVGINHLNYRSHRIIFKMYYGYEPLVIDHINGDSLDNKISNLRSVTTRENSRNSCKHKNSKTDGVWYRPDRKTWVGAISIDRKSISKSFKTEEEAIQHRKFLKEKYNFHPNHGRERTAQ